MVQSNRACTARSVAYRRSFVAGSNAENGSSSSSISGSSTKARASAVRCDSPPLMMPGYRSARCPISNNESMACTRSSRSRGGQPFIRRP